MTAVNTIRNHIKSAMFYLDDDSIHIDDLHHRHCIRVAVVYRNRKFVAEVFAANYHFDEPIWVAMSLVDALTEKIKQAFPKGPCAIPDDEGKIVGRCEWRSPDLTDTTRGEHTEQRIIVHHPKSAPKGEHTRAIVGRWYPNETGPGIAAKIPAPTQTPVVLCCDHGWDD